MVKHILKFLRCLRRKILKYVWLVFNAMHERVNGKKNQNSAQMILVNENDVTISSEIVILFL